MVNYILITNDPKFAHYAEMNGVSRIFVDLEKNGKNERQGHLDTFISTHTMKDVAKVKANLVKAELMVRLNPLNENSSREVDEAIEGGADLLMLPMFYSAKEVQCFVEIVHGRVGVIPLVETHSAALALDEIVCITGLAGIYIGLNDLHMDMKLKFMFEPLANGFIDRLAQTIKAAGLPFGFGGIARVDEGIIPGKMVLGEHLRLGSTSVILSRTFNRNSEITTISENNKNLRDEVEKLNIASIDLETRDIKQMAADHLQLERIVIDFVGKRK